MEWDRAEGWAAWSIEAREVEWADVRAKPVPGNTRPKNSAKSE